MSQNKPLPFLSQLPSGISPQREKATNTQLEMAPLLEGCCCGLVWHSLPSGTWVAGVSRVSSVWPLGNTPPGGGPLGCQSLSCSQVHNGLCCVTALKRASQSSIMVTGSYRLGGFPPQPATYFTVPNFDKISSDVKPGQYEVGLSRGVASPGVWQADKEGSGFSKGCALPLM